VLQSPLLLILGPIPTRELKRETVNILVVASKVHVRFNGINYQTVDGRRCLDRFQGAASWDIVDLEGLIHRATESSIHRGSAEADLCDFSGVVTELNKRLLLPSEE
jgi:hypothetical protein